MKRLELNEMAKVEGGIVGCLLFGPAAIGCVVGLTAMFVVSSMFASRAY